MTYDNFPKDIKEILNSKNGLIDDLGMSNTNVILYENMVLKISANYIESQHESAMLKWLVDKLPIPQITGYAQNNENSYILNCPYNLSLDHKLNIEEHKILQGLYKKPTSEDSNYHNSGFNSAEDLLYWLKNNKPDEDLIFSHGDLCLPNIFINQNKINGFIDLGQSGIADRYRDIALYYRSLKDNLSGVYSGKIYSNFNLSDFFDALDISPDYDKIAYYILLDELYE
ncbi:phosphotransferase [Acinetobacter nectaris]|uniref:phosphotransferase n=1 Tax=Acinetobacter nectaris TaxID=1219382 RepID=UPI001F45491D|nr:phosphotransferase [Acinetobacter nectaris]MCF9047503.1 phosphotransferase [Acinetobacter nectaris]